LPLVKPSRPSVFDIKQVAWIASDWRVGRDSWRILQVSPRIVIPILMHYCKVIFKVAEAPFQ
jgi:hypothetical protein